MAGIVSTAAVSPSVLRALFVLPLLHRLLFLHTLCVRRLPAGRKRNRNRKQIRIRLHRKASAARLRKTLRDGKSKSAAAVGAALIAAHETLRKVLRVRKFHTGSILDARNSPSILLCQRKIYTRTFQRIAQCVLQKILEHPIKSLPVRRHRYRLLGNQRPYHKRALTNPVIHIRQRLPQELSHIQHLHLDRQLARGGLADLKHILHDAAQPLRLFPQNLDILFHMLGQLFLLPQQLRIADDGGERRLDVVGHVGHQFHLHPLALHLLCKRRLHALLYLV